VSMILVAEDEPGIASFIVKGLTAAGHMATVVGDGNLALADAVSGEYDLMILDLGLPGRDGLSVLSELRIRGSTLPIVILTARDTVDTLVSGLELGASDFIAKPFRFDELLARIRTRLRDEFHREIRHHHLGDIEVDVAARRVSRGGEVVELTAREFQLFETFLDHTGQVLSRQQLLSRAWGRDYEGDSNVVDVCVLHLRKKLGPDIIRTIRGIGYRLDAPADRGVPQVPERLDELVGGGGEKIAMQCSPHSILGS
jgi:DNA-binding response OmpR family regulator